MSQSVQTIVRPEDVKPWYNSDNPWGNDPHFLPTEVAAIALCYGAEMARFHVLINMPRNAQQEIELRAVGVSLTKWASKFLEMSKENYGR